MRSARSLSNQELSERLLHLAVFLSFQERLQAKRFAQEAAKRLLLCRCPQTKRAVPEGRP
jgi:hypothetical protein